MAAKFKADSVFIIHGKGLVIDGELTEGTVKVGMKTRIPSWPNELTISGVQPVYRRDRKPGEVVLISLLFSSQDEREYDRWRALDLKDQILEIQD
jgi:hypothetical protein